MDKNVYNMLMKYFPPVENSIENIYIEASYSYTLYNAISPLKPPDKNLTYSPQIINDLKILRSLLNSNLTFERFFYEINKMYEAWGPQGRNIIIIQFINLFENIKFKQIKLNELIKEGNLMTTDYQLKNLEQEIGKISFKNKSKDIKDLDLIKLNLNKTIGKRRVNKKK